MQTEVPLWVSACLCDSSWFTTLAVVCTCIWPVVGYPGAVWAGVTRLPLFYFLVTDVSELNSEQIQLVEFSSQVTSVPLEYYLLQIWWCLQRYKTNSFVFYDGLYKSYSATISTFVIYWSNWGFNFNCFFVALENAWVYVCNSNLHAHHISPSPHGVYVRNSNLLGYLCLCP